MQIATRVATNLLSVVPLVGPQLQQLVVGGADYGHLTLTRFFALHAGVLESAAVGVPDEKSGEVVKLFVVKKDPALTAEALMTHLRANLTGYKVPRTIVFRADLPKTNVGKILRRELRGA